jgi:hypothetical protein
MKVNRMKVNQMNTIQMKVNTRLNKTCNKQIKNYSEVMNNYPVYAVYATPKIYGIKFFYSIFKTSNHTTILLSLYNSITPCSSLISCMDGI